MAVPELSSQNAVIARMHELLRRARAIKRSTSIDPPLQASALIEGDEALVESVGKEGDALVEGAAKSIFYATVGSADIEDESFVTVWNLFDILQSCADRNLCSPQLPLLLLEELFDSLSIDQCQIALSYLESRREAIIAARSQSKDMVILRLCNELLRRLSRAEDPVFCGRVYIFLFRSFPLADKSSVNLRGKFHTENVTTFEDYLQASLPTEDAMQIDASGSNSDGKHGVPTRDQTQVATSGGSGSVVGSGASATRLDTNSFDDETEAKERKPTMDIHELYPVFWSLQQSFSNPPRLFEQDRFQEFQKGLEATLAKFKEVPKVIQAGDSARKTRTQSRSDDKSDQFASAFNPKYLTSRDLFKLELSDLAFQRHILVQALIMIDFLLTLTEESKSKPYYVDAQKAMQYSFTLRDQDAEWALGIKRSIANYLHDGPDGKVYYRMVDTVLSRDKNWVMWKMENCHSFTRDRVPAKNFAESKDGAKKAVGTRKVPKPMRYSLGMQFLDNTEPGRGLAQLKHHERFSKPSLDDYAQRVKAMEADPPANPSDEDKRPLGEKIRSVTWRGYRLGCKEKLGSYDKPALPEEKRLKGSEASTGDDSAPTEPVDRDPAPQAEHPSVEDQRPDQQDQMTAATAAEVQQA